MALLQPAQAGDAAADSIAPIHALPPLVDDIASHILAYGVLLAAIATIVMALLELVKGLLRLRMMFHRWHLTRWVFRSANGRRIPWRRRLPAGAQKAPALTQLEALCSVQSSDVLAIYELPADQMVHHLRGAAGVAIDFPDKSPELFTFLTDLTPEEWKSISGATDDGGEWSPTAIRERAKVDHFVTRRLDAFQTHLEYWWARLNQYTAVGGGTLFIIAMLSLSGGAAWSGARVLQTVVLAAFGGMLAPFAKDVVSALINLRAKVD